MKDSSATHTQSTMSPNNKIEPWFKVEREAAAKIDPIRVSENWTELASVLASLCEARQAIAKSARNGKRVRVIDSLDDVESIKEEGRYLVKPPLVARDASIIDHAFKLNGIPAIVICREPTTNAGLCPIVALGSGVTIRVQIEEPSNPNKPPCKWFDLAVESLGDRVVSQMDTDATTLRQLNYILAHLSATPMHANVHQVAIALCDTLAKENT